MSSNLCIKGFEPKLTCFHCYVSATSAEGKERSSRKQKGATRSVGKTNRSARWKCSKTNQGYARRLNRITYYGCKGYKGGNCIQLHPNWTERKYVLVYILQNNSLADPPLLAIQFKLIQRSNDSNEMQYRPMLDPHRDAALISALPPYLTFDIDFQKDKANLFYWKLSSALHSKP